MDAGAEVFRYLFSLRTPDGSDAEFVPHGHDLALLFQKDDDPSMALPRARTLARRLLGFWTRFAASGTPNANGAATGGEWPAFSDCGELLRLDEDVAVVAGWQDAQCDWWDRG